MITTEEKTEVKKALLEFILRVAEGKNASSAEVEVLPNIVEIFASI